MCQSFVQFPIDGKDKAVLNRLAHSLSRRTQNKIKMHRLRQTQVVWLVTCNGAFIESPSVDAPMLPPAESFAAALILAICAFLSASV